MKQEELETVDQFVVRDQIRDQIIDKCKSTQLRRKPLIKGQALTLEETQRIARSLKLSQAQARQIEDDTNRNVSVNATKGKELKDSTVKKGSDEVLPM